MSKLIRIEHVEPLDAYRVRLTLTDGAVVERDVAPYLTGPALESVRLDRAVFTAVRVDGGALVWPSGVDLCPDVVIWGGAPPADASTHAA